MVFKIEVQRGFKGYNSQVVVGFLGIVIGDFKQIIFFFGVWRVLGCCDLFFFFIFGGIDLEFFLIVTNKVICKLYGCDFFLLFFKGIGFCDEFYVVGCFCFKLRVRVEFRGVVCLFLSFWVFKVGKFFFIQVSREVVVVLFVQFVVYIYLRKGRKGVLGCL